MLYTMGVTVPRVIFVTLMVVAFLLGAAVVAEEVAQAVLAVRAVRWVAMEAVEEGVAAVDLAAARKRRRTFRRQRGKSTRRHSCQAFPRSDQSGRKTNSRSIALREERTSQV